jgi:hypothetical protein
MDERDITIENILGVARFAGPVFTQIDVSVTPIVDVGITKFAMLVVPTTLMIPSGPIADKVIRPSGKTG